MVTRAFLRPLSMSASSAKLLTLQVELLDVVLAPGIELDAPHVATLCLRHRLALLAHHQVDHGRVRIHHHRVARQVLTLSPNLTQDLVRDSGARLNLPRAVAVEA